MTQFLSSTLPRIPADLFDRYLTGDCTPEERYRVEQAIAQNPDLQSIHQIVTAPTDTDALWARFVQTQWAPQQPAKPVTRTIPRVGWYAASFVALVCVVVAGWLVRVRPTSDPVNPATQVWTYTTGNGQRATVMLPDGNTVDLNVASRLEIPADYLNGNHTVRLYGEGLFTIRHRSDIPFSVMAGPSVTRVLGTTFRVRSYEEDTAAVIAVHEGKVAVGSAVLTAAQRVAVTTRGPGQILGVPATDGAFSSGTLVLSNTLLRDAIPDLNRWFDADVRLGDPRLATLRLGIEYQSGSVHDLVELFELTFDLRVVRLGRVLTLYPRR